MPFPAFESRTQAVFEMLKERRSEEIGGRGERFDRVAQRPNEFSHGFSKGLIILDDRYQCMLRHRGWHNLLGPDHTGAPSAVAPACKLIMSEKLGRKAMPARLSDGLCARLSAYA